MPGYIPPTVGMYHPDGFIYESRIQGIKTVLLPDRNIVSRLAQVARGEPLDKPRRLAAAVLAFAQCLDIDIETSIAFHELAPNQGNDAAHHELAWFRVADNGNPHDWIAAAIGQIDRIQPIDSPPEREQLDLSKPLRRWRRNYIVALKMGELELSDLSPLERILGLFQWMYEDFVLAGPAAMLACVYFAPNSPPRQGLLKHLRSPHRERAIKGAQNAAWDITHLSDFVRRINDEPEGRTRFVFATFDIGLRSIARLLENGADTNEPDRLTLALQQWWPIDDARRISETIFNCYRQPRSPEWLKLQQDQPNYINDLIAQGEAILRG